MECVAYPQHSPEDTFALNMEYPLTLGDSEGPTIHSCGLDILGSHYKTQPSVHKGA